MRGIIVGGREYPCRVPVRSFRDTGLEYRVGSPGVTARDRLIDTIVCHWTAAENEPETVFRNLQRRKCAVEFAIGGHGELWQFCDPARANAHDCGGRWDPRSVGIEATNYGMRWPASKPWNLFGTPAAGRDRELVRTRLNGRPVYVAAFRPAARVAYLALVETLLEALPHVVDRVPRDPETGEVLDRPFTPREARHFAGGVVGHLHISSTGKADPGLPLLEELDAALVRSADPGPLAHGMHLDTARGVQ